MKFSIKVKYGLQAALELALRYTGGTIQIGEIARKQKIPVRYLEQLLLILKRRGLVKSTRGKQGGYALAAHPGEISLLSIFEAFEGTLDLCVCHKNIRKSSVICELFDELSAGLNKKLAETTLEDLVFRKKQQERTQTYDI